MRKWMKDQEVGLDPYFRYRGKNQTRVEAFSDAAFALAVTLLVLSSSVPETFSELKDSMRMIIPFGISVTLIALIWYQHYVFFLKYGLQDKVIIAFNSVLIFLILVYVYPLKFLSRFLFELFVSVFTGDYAILNSAFGDLNMPNMRFLMVMYGLGASFIFLMLAIMYLSALKRSKLLELDAYERFITRSSLVTNVLMGFIPLLSVLLSLIDFGSTSLTFSIAGFSYFLYPIVMPVYGFIVRKQLKKQFPDYI